MSSRFSEFIKKKVVRKDQNLVSLEEPYAALRKYLASRRVTAVLDAGASSGHISERLLRMFPDAQAYGFEPNPMYKKALTGYAQRELRFHPFFCALSDRTGEVNLNVTRSAGNTSLLRPLTSLSQIDPDGAPVEQTVSIPMTTIDEWAANQGVSAIEVMKFDIQGYELNALKGAANMLKNSTLAVYTEVWFNPVYEQSPLLGDVDAFLRTTGFVLFDLFKPKYNPSGMLQWSDALFLHAGRMEL